MPSPPVAPTLLEANRQLGGCRIERLLARGGMGEVYLARHLRLDCTVAIKVLPPTNLDAAHVERFKKEARAAARVKHPNVVTIHDLGEESGHHYIVMDLIEGKNLAQVVGQQGGPLPWRSALKIIRLAAKGLAAVHAANLIHRDIKPSNIMLTRDSRVILMDFGLVHDESQTDLTRTGAIVGTPAFMSPEQCRGESLDRRSDVFSLGSTLYFLLTGRMPFEGANVHSVMSQIASGHAAKSIQTLNPFVPEEVEQLVRQAMAPRAPDRLADGAAFANAISKTLKRVGVTESQSIDTSRISLFRTDQVAAVPPQDLLPEVVLIGEDDLSAIRIRRFVPWIVAACAAVSCVFLAMILNAVFSPNPTEQKSPRVATPESKLELPPSKQPGDVVTEPDKLLAPEGMVRIPAGDVIVGDSEKRLRVYFEALGRSRNAPNLVTTILSKWDAAYETKVSVPGFWIDTYEVTNASYEKFVKATGHRPPSHWLGNSPPVGQKEWPVTHVNLDDASQYARWAGKQLPTELQWVRAYRSDTRQLFPWGDDFERTRPCVLQNPQISSANPCDVQRTEGDRSAFGVFNLVGNVQEMLRDKVTRQGALWVVLKGCGFNSDGEVYGLASSRFFFSDSLDKLKDQNDTGFRCVLEDSAQAPSVSMPSQ